MHLIQKLLRRKSKYIPHIVSAIPKLYFRTKYSIVYYLPGVSAGLFAEMEFNPDYQNHAVPFSVLALSNPAVLLNSLPSVRSSLYPNPSLSCGKGQSQAPRLVSCKHVTGTQPDFEVSKPLECS